MLTLLILRRFGNKKNNKKKTKLKLLEFESQIYCFSGVLSAFLVVKKNT